MASMHPGKHSKKRVADMTTFELEQHRIYHNSVHHYLKSLDPSRKQVANNYLGKYCRKKVADMTQYEHEQHKIRCNYYAATYNRANKNSEAYKIKARANSAAYKKRNPDAVRERTAKASAAIRADPARYAEHLRKKKTYNSLSVSSASDYYMRSLIRESSGMPTALITNEMIVLHRATLTIKRLIKTMN